MPWRERPRWWGAGSPGGRIGNATAMAATVVAAGGWQPLTFCSDVRQRPVIVSAVSLLLHFCTTCCTAGTSHSHWLVATSRRVQAATGVNTLHAARAHTLRAARQRQPVGVSCCPW
ncbi:hypothetical protein PC119_g19717 [Phytophthora cactorum]|nr:hypothetical protein PC119_g19717 [Phytophthora cactorum]